MKESSYFTRVHIFKVETNSRDSDAEKQLKLITETNYITKIVAEV